MNDSANGSKATTPSGKFIIRPAALASAVGKGPGCALTGEVKVLRSCALCAGGGPSLCVPATKTASENQQVIALHCVLDDNGGRSTRQASRACVPPEVWSHEHRKHNAQARNSRALTHQGSQHTLWSI
jgi:hypothetical protein